MIKIVVIFRPDFGNHNAGVQFRSPYLSVVLCLLQLVNLWHQKLTSSASTLAVDLILERPGSFTSKEDAPLNIRNALRQKSFLTSCLFGAELLKLKDKLQQIRIQAPIQATSQRVTFKRPLREASFSQQAKRYNQEALQI